MVGGDEHSSAPRPTAMNAANTWNSIISRRENVAIGNVVHASHFDSSERVKRRGYKLVKVTRKNCENGGPWVIDHRFRITSVPEILDAPLSVHGALCPSGTTEVHVIRCALEPSIPNFAAPDNLSLSASLFAFNTVVYFKLSRWSAIGPTPTIAD
uniref:START domain-containing protein n=1 Tax=Ascaris lumbricoides TaxID=6252 RepID=A0A0M3HMP0_ASCLU